MINLIGITTICKKNIISWKINYNILNICKSIVRQPHLLTGLLMLIIVITLSVLINITINNQIILNKQIILNNKLLINNKLPISHNPIPNRYNKPYNNYKHVYK